jgi:hypothetical protein
MTGGAQQEFVAGRPLPAVEPTRARVDGVAGARAGTTRGGPGALNLEPAPPMTCCMQAMPGALGARTQARR